MRELGGGGYRSIINSELSLSLFVLRFLDVHERDERTTADGLGQASLYA